MKNPNNSVNASPNSDRDIPAPLPSRSLQLPFEGGSSRPKTPPPRPLPKPPGSDLEDDSDDPISPPARSLSSLKVPNPPRIRQPDPELAPEPLSLYQYLDDMEDRLTRRLYWLQKRMSAVERKVEAQWRFLFFLIVLWLGFIYFAFFHTPTRQVTPAPNSIEQQSKPQLQLS